jgi:hypothetical protein
MLVKYETIATNFVLKLDIDDKLILVVNNPTTKFGTASFTAVCVMKQLVIVAVLAALRRLARKIGQLKACFYQCEFVLIPRRWFHIQLYCRSVIQDMLFVGCRSHTF